MGRIESTRVGEAPGTARRSLNRRGVLALWVAGSLVGCGQAPSPSDQPDEPLGQSQAALLAGTALFVANGTTLSDADNRLRNRLEILGLQVAVKAATSATSADANGKVLVVISSTVAPSAVNTKFRTVPVPVLTWESELYDDLGMTPTSAGNFGTQSGQKSLAVSAGHPLAAGLSGTQLVFSEPNSPGLTSTFNWGKPNANAARVATIPSDGARFAVFGYEAGAVMPGLVAPARRVGFFVGDTTATNLTANGWALFEAAVTFALGTTTPPAGNDADGDRLPDSAETNTGIFVSASNTGTNPNVADTDGDGINDGDEVLGTSAGLNLPALGLSPLRKNVLLEYDWFADSLECGAHDHRPTPAAIAKVAAAFAASPVSNPDGTTGITLVQDYGQGGAFTGGNRIADPDGVLGGTFDAEYQGYKTANFAPARSGYFHYVIMPHRYDTTSDSSGYAEIVGDDMIVSLYCANQDQNVANTIMHELGHNLGLQHGGLDGTNFKPNYNSVMNYQYQFPGVDTNCTPPGDGLLDYSRNRRNTLDETALRESIGICNNVAWDWNGNGTIDAGTVHADVNFDAFESTLTDYDDWGNLVYRWQSSSFARVLPRAVACDNPAPLP
jgi:hypothetical protein